MQQAINKYHKTEVQLDRETQLVLAAKKNPKHFEVLYNENYESIFRYVYQRMDDKEQAFDITQQVFLKALTNIEKFEPKGVPFAAWLFRIAQNELNSAYKKDKANRTVNIDTTHLTNLMHDVEENPLADLEKQMMKHIKTLSEDDLQLIEMRYFENRSFKDIAEILNMTETNAKVRVHRIIQKLKIVMNA
ncbi:MAG: RNA polymerase sigma factor [Bacteroidia bacterium]